MPPPVIDTGPPNPRPASWLCGAAIAGVELYRDIETHQLRAIVDRVASEGVTVLELDSELSFYLSDDDFAVQLELLNRAANAAHRRGLRAVAYYPSLEVLTPGADDETTATMARDHPEWVQRDLFGRLNTFIGGDGRVFWVDPGTESAWMCPLTGFADYFLERVKLLAGTTLDGLWPDVPLLSDIAAEWPCTCDLCREQVLADIGVFIPTFEEGVGMRGADGVLLAEAEEWPNFGDAGFRRWVHWRHKVIWDYEQRILSAARSVDPAFEVIVETVTMDYSGATVQGLDAAALDSGEVHRAWEVDAISDGTGMREAAARDWLNMAVMMKHGRGCAGDLPSWMFCYGKQEDDAEHVLGLALATHNCPFEAKIPDMLTSVDTDYRRRAFELVGAVGPFFEGESLAQVAVVYSSASRDMVDRNRGVGLYSGLNPGDDLWWSDTHRDDSMTLPYLSDYRGICGLLMHLSEPFDVVIGPRVTAERLARYRLVVLPSAEALSEAQIEALASFAEAGGTLVTTGEGLGRYDEDGTERASAALQARLGVEPGQGLTPFDVGQGRVLATKDRAGRSHMTGVGDPRALIAAALNEARAAVVTTDAPDGVILEARRHEDGSVWVALGNLEGLGEVKDFAGRFAPRPATITLRVADSTLSTARLHTPGALYQPLETMVGAGAITVALTVAAAAVVELR